jgi:hypothetical protein
LLCKGIILTANIAKTAKKNIIHNIKLACRVSIVNRGSAENTYGFSAENTYGFEFFLFLSFEIWISWIFDIEIYFVVFGFWILYFHQRWKFPPKVAGGGVRLEVIPQLFCILH